MTIIDSQFYITDSLSLDVSFERNANLVIVWLYKINHLRNEFDFLNFHGVKKVNFARDQKYS